jgi:serine/threonine-protein kinase
MVHYMPGGTRLTQLVLVGALACLPALAHAAPSAADRAAAEVLFDSAVKLLEAGNGKEACPKLEESQRLDPGVGTLLYLAECYRIIGRTASAWATFRDASYAADSAGQQDRAQIATSEAAKLKPMLSYLSLAVSDQQLAGLEIRRDGEVLNRALWTSPIPIDPGQHQLEASAPGKLPWLKSMVIAPQPGTTAITIPTLRDEPVEQAAVPATSPAQAAQAPATAPAAPTALSGAPADARAADSSQKTLGWVAVGVGGLGVAVGGVFGYLASQDNNAADEQCRQDDPKQCNSEGVQLADQAKSRAMLSSIAFGVGLAAATTGVVLILTAPDEADAVAQRQLWLAASSKGDGAEISLGGAW